jgi:hypothetical protein
MRQVTTFRKATKHIRNCSVIYGHAVPSKTTYSHVVALHSRQREATFVYRFPSTYSQMGNASMLI